MTERKRGAIADYADCIDDDYMVADMDDSVCDDERDGLTLEEAAEYEKECEVSRALSRALMDELGYEGYREWRKDLCQM